MESAIATRKRSVVGVSSLSRADRMGGMDLVRKVAELLNRWGPCGVMLMDCSWLNKWIGIL